MLFFTVTYQHADIIANSIIARANKLYGAALSVGATCLTARSRHSNIVLRSSRDITGRGIWLHVREPHPGARATAFHK